MYKLPTVLRTGRYARVCAINLLGLNQKVNVTLLKPQQPELLECSRPFSLNQRNWSAPTNNQGVIEVDSVTYERVCAETLDSLCDFFEELLESTTNLTGSDVSYSDGVLTVNLGQKYGTYVINRQTPNKQIWLSSPTSGPKRYDFIGGQWIYKHNNESMHELLQREFKVILGDGKFDFYSLPYAR